MIGSIIKVILILPALASAPNVDVIRDYSVYSVIQGNSYQALSVPPVWPIEHELWVASTKYGINYERLRDTIQCESKICESHETCFGDNGLAFGIAQFHENTWYTYCEGDYLTATEEQQLSCMAKMWSMGLQRHWTCYSKIVKN